MGQINSKQNKQNKQNQIPKGSKGSKQFPKNVQTLQQFDPFDVQVNALYIDRRNGTKEVQRIDLHVTPLHNTIEYIKREEEEDEVVTYTKFLFSYMLKIDVGDRDIYYVNLKESEVVYEPTDWDMNYI